MNISQLTAISPVDGRYAGKVSALRPITSEYGLIRYRLFVEVHWLKMLSLNPAIREVARFSDGAMQYLKDIINNFNEKEAAEVKEIEKTTNHDVKAVEYYLKNKIKHHEELSKYSEFIHFACTSEDINNISYALMLKDAQGLLVSQYDAIIRTLRQFTKRYARVAMLGRTHGQAASPTTVGKEFANFVTRLERQMQQLKSWQPLAKLNGAVGNFNAHIVAYPDIDWANAGQKFIESLQLSYNPYTTQIEPHDCISEVCHIQYRLNTILIDLARDVWGYISLDYFKQHLNNDEVGSSTMPHKVNPIDFENAEGNFGIANAMLVHFSEKLPISRWQRDLSDSTVLRALWDAFGHTLIALSALEKGLGKIAVNEEVLAADLDNHWEVLAEPLQTVMRRHGIENPYEQLKSLTRGKGLTQEAYRDFVNSLEIPDGDKSRLAALTPSTYVGLAGKLAESL